MLAVLATLLFSAFCCVVGCFATLLSNIGVGSGLVTALKLGELFFFGGGTMTRGEMIAIDDNGPPNLGKLGTQRPHGQPFELLRGATCSYGISRRSLVDDNAFFVLRSTALPAGYDCLL